MSSSTKAPAYVDDDSAVGTRAWVNSQNAYAPDSVYASAVASAETVDTHYLKAYQYGFAIPAYSTIDGIEVKVTRKASYSSGTNYAKDTRVSLYKADGSVGTANKADTSTLWPTSNVTVTYGGATDKWGETWSVADINDADFGVAFQARVRSSSGTNRYGYVDYIEVIVYHTAGSAPANTGNFLMFF